MQSLCAFFAASVSPAAAENLVPNPSFETYTLCPLTYSQLDRTVSWTSPTDATPDYAHACSAGNMGVPDNAVGSQTARTGSAYTGIRLYDPNPGNWREYIEAELTSPLEANELYFVPFYVSLADTSYYTTSRVGAHLSVGSTGPQAHTHELGLTPQVANIPGNMIKNDTGWKRISGFFLAAGSEDHITIGNFYDNANTPTELHPGGSIGFAYVYVDEVSVSSLPSVPSLDGRGLLGLGLALAVGGAAIVARGRRMMA